MSSNASLELSNAWNDATYNALDDMLDSNRLGVFTPNNFGIGVNIVGSSA